MDYLELQQDSTLEYCLVLDECRNSHFVSDFGSQLKSEFSCEVGAEPSLRKGVLAFWGIRLRASVLHTTKTPATSGVVTLER